MDYVGVKLRKLLEAKKDDPATRLNAAYDNGYGHGRNAGMSINKRKAYLVIQKKHPDMTANDLQRLFVQSAITDEAIEAHLSSSLYRQFIPKLGDGSNDAHVRQVAWIKGFKEGFKDGFALDLKPGGE